MLEGLSGRRSLRFDGPGQARGGVDPDEYRGRLRACRSSAELGRFLGIALGSASELDYHFILADDLVYLMDPDSGRLGEDVAEVKRMLTGLAQRARMSKAQI